MAHTEKTDSSLYFSPVSTEAAEQFGRLAPSRADQKVRPGRKNFDHLLFAPVHYEPRYAYPLIVWLHGNSRSEQELFEVMPKLSLRNYTAVAPRAPKWTETKLEGGYCPLYGWSAQTVQEAEERIFRAIDKAKAGCNIAPNRIFLAGSGSGGTMALRIGTKYPGFFAGAVSLGGAFPLTDQPLSCWEEARSFPMMMTVGTKSRRFSPKEASEQLRLFYAAGLSVSIRQYNTAEELTKPIFRDVNNWLMEQVLDRSKK